MKNCNCFNEFSLGYMETASTETQLTGNCVNRNPTDWKLRQQKPNWPATASTETQLTGNCVNRNPTDRKLRQQKPNWPETASTETQLTGNCVSRNPTDWKLRQQKPNWLETASAETQLTLQCDFFCTQSYVQSSHDARHVAESDHGRCLLLMGLICLGCSATSSGDGCTVPFSCIKTEEFRKQLSNPQLMKDSAPWI
jgi:hypothetical protein